MAQAQAGPTQWRQLAAAVAVLGAVLVAANFLTWFSVERTQTNPVGTYTRTAMGFEGRFGYLEVAYGLVAVMIGVLCLVKPPTEPAVLRSLGFLVVVPLVGIACAVADGVVVAQGSGTVTPGIGLIVTLVVLVAMLACGFLLRRQVPAGSRVPR